MGAGSKRNGGSGCLEKLLLVVMESVVAMSVMLADVLVVMTQTAKVGLVVWSVARVGVVGVVVVVVVVVNIE